MSGENLTHRTSEVLESWFEGRSLVEELGASSPSPLSSRIVNCAI